jgi:hypothetical protein
LDGDQRTRGLSERIASLAHTLDRIAQAFEEADRLDQRGFSYLADQFRLITESGYDTSSFPSWLIRGQCPPWIHPKFWNRLPFDDRDAILSSIGGAWPEFMESGNYNHGLKEDTWNAFLVYLYFQGVVFKPPELEVWNSATRAAGMDLEVYISKVTGIRQTNVEAWFRAAETHDFSQEFAIHEMAAMAKADMTFEEHFGYTLRGRWTVDDKDAIAEGVLLVSHSLARVTPAQDTPDQAFQKMFGNPTFTLKESGETEKWSCSGGGYGMRCEPLARNRMSPQLTAHELGYSFNARITNNIQGDLSVYGSAAVPEDILEFSTRKRYLQPYEILHRSTITAESNGNIIHVTGINDMGVFERTDNGYRSTGMPWEQHGMSMDKYGNTPNEDFADMFLNWAFDSFADDPMGEARYDWMEENMAEWFEHGTEPYQDSWIPGD